MDDRRQHGPVVEIAQTTTTVKTDIDKYEDIAICLGFCALAKTWQTPDGSPRIACYWAKPAIYLKGEYTPGPNCPGKGKYRLVKVNDITP